MKWVGEELLGKEITGARFKARIEAGHVFKLVNEKNQSCFGDFEYKPGHIEDHVPFNPTGSCKPGGIYFTLREYLPEFRRFGDKAVVITLYDDSRVYVEDRKFKADKFFVESIVNLRDVIDDQTSVKTLMAMLEYPYKRFGNPTTREVWNYAVCNTPDALQFIPRKKQIYSMCRNAVVTHALAIKHVRDDLIDDEMIKDMLESRPHSISYLKPEHRSAEICLTAVVFDFTTFKCITVDEQTYEMCAIAVSQCPSFLSLVREDLKEMAFGLDPSSERGQREQELVKERGVAAIAEDGMRLKFVENTSELWIDPSEMCLAAVRSAGEAIQFVPEDLRTRELCITAVLNNPHCIRHISERSEELCIAAVVTKPLSIVHLTTEEKSETVCYAANVKNSLAIKFMSRSMCICVQSLTRYMARSLTDTLTKLTQEGFAVSTL